MFALLFFISVVFINTAVSIDNVFLSDTDVSFVVHGNRIQGMTFNVSSYSCDSWCAILVAAEIRYPNSTNIVLQDQNSSYSEQYISYNRNLSLIPPVTVTVGNGGNTEFALTFTLLKKGQSLQTFGVSNYAIDPIARGSGIDDYWIMNTSLSHTLVQGNFDTQWPLWKIDKFQIFPGCSLDVFIGGWPSESGRERHRVTTLKNDSQLIDSYVRSSGLTYSTPENCPFNISVKSLTADQNIIVIFPGQFGFLMSREYPGSFGSDKLPAVNQNTQLYVTLGDVVNITFEIQSIDCGQDGYLYIGSDLETPVPINSATGGKMWMSVVGTNFHINYVPGKGARTGYLIRYSVAPYVKEPSIQYITLTDSDSSFAVHGVRMQGKTLKLSQQQCAGCTVRMVAQIYEKNTTVISIRDSVNNEYSVNDLVGHAVTLIAPTTVVVPQNSSSNFVLTFTTLKPGQTSFNSFGIDQYTPISIDYNSQYSLSDTKRTNLTRAQTMVGTNTEQQPSRMAISGFYTPSGCTIDVYTGGLQSVSGWEMYRLTTLSSNSSYSMSYIRSTALTYVTKPDCPYNISVVNLAYDDYNATVSPGQSGFVMSPGYPGSQGWIQSSDNAATTTVLKVKDGQTLNFNFHIVSLSSGTGGQLVFQRYSDSSVFYNEVNKVFSMKDTQISIKWAPGSIPHGGFLVRYTVDDGDQKKEDKSSRNQSILQSIVVFLIVCCLR